MSATHFVLYLTLAFWVGFIAGQWMVFFSVRKKLKSPKARKPQVEQVVQEDGLFYKWVECDALGHVKNRSATAPFWKVQRLLS